MAALPYRTFSDIFGRAWPGGASPEITGYLGQLGITAAPGSAQANLALQSALLSGWRPGQAAAPAPAVDYNAQTAAATAREEQKARDLFAQQEATTNAKIAALRAYVEGAEPVPELRARLAAELGIPELSAQLEPVRQQTLRAESQLATLPEDLLAVTRGQGEARRKLLEASKSDVLRRQLTELARGQELYAGQLAGAQGELGQQMTAYGQQYTRGLLPFEADLTATENRLAREASGYMQIFQDQLSAELEGITNARDYAQQVSLMALENTYKLAQMEKDFQYQASLQKSGSGGGGTPINKDVIKGKVLSGIQSYRSGVRSGVPNTQEGIKGAILALGGDPNDPYFKGLYAWIATGGGFGLSVPKSKSSSSGGGKVW